MGRGDVQMARSSASPGQESRKGEVTACVCGGGGGVCRWSLTEHRFLTLTCAGGQDT